MRRWHILIGGLLLPAVLALSCRSGPDAGTGRAEIQSILQEIAADWEKADISSFLANAADDFRFFTLDGRNLNRQQAEEFLQPMFQRWWDRHMTLEDVEVFAGRTFAWGRYRATFSFMAPSGKTELKHLVTVIFRKDGGNWRMVQFHMSAKPL